MTVLRASESSDRFEELGKFGLFQKIQYILICIPLSIVSLSFINYIFIVEDIHRRCRVPECENKNSTIQIPEWWPENSDSKCYRPVINVEKYKQDKGICTNESFLNVLEECQEWIYESNNSIVAEFNFGCEAWKATLVGSVHNAGMIASVMLAGWLLNCAIRVNKSITEFNFGCEAWKATLVGSVHNAGMIASVMLAGWISDKIGRKPTFILYSVGGSIGVIKMFLTNYYAYLVVEFLESFFSSGMLTVAVVLLIEVGGETKRVAAGVIFSYATYVGEIIYAFLAMSLQYWKSIVLVAYSPMVLFIFFVFIVKESTRWQMLRGKIIDAKFTFKSIAKMNKLNVSSKQIDDVSDDDLRKIFNVEIKKEKECISQIIRSKEIMIRLAVTCICFFSSGFIYCGFLIHSIYLPGNKYTNFALSSLTSFPGELLAYYAFNSFGRKITLQCGYFATAIFTIAQAYTPDSISWLKLLLFLLGKFGIVVCFTGMFTYSLELFPTSVRGSLVGCGNTAARVGTMLAPLTPLLTTELKALPSILFSFTAVLAGLLLILTPETRTLPMFDTIAQIEVYKLKNKTERVN